MDVLRNLAMLFEAIAIVSFWTGLAALVIIESALALLDWSTR